LALPSSTEQHHAIQWQQRFKVPPLRGKLSWQFGAGSDRVLPLALLPISGGVRLLLT
jgi:hypothetical protein